ncbi:ATP-dependent endonuclease [Leucobacter albus]|uniref:ATP-dependent endonuclease n=1 Tax=Leucobacter albus TaxID=272210 RepID=A0ABW3TM70_9MICO
MITRIKATNYRCFKSLDFVPHEGMNIIVGGNEAGKSTLLEVISLLVGGRVRGRWAADDLNPYWFNHDVVRQYFAAHKAGQNPALPEIDLEIYFSDDAPGVATLLGAHNSLRLKCPGIRMRVRPDSDHHAELEAYLAEDELPELLPTDLYQVSWHAFSGDPITRQPRGLGVALVNSNTSSTHSGVDYKLRQLLRDFVKPQESAKIALEHRTSKAKISNGILRTVNERIAKDEGSFGVSLQMDQSANSNWDTVVAPHVEETPFAMLGQGRQVATKIALAMSRSAEHTQLVLLEEPENHLSHTELQSVIEKIQTLSNGRQCFVTTHSSFVLNRLGFKSLHLMHESRIIPFDASAISADTMAYFKKQSGYDTLRLVLANRVVVVEGPSDEMIFNLAFEKVKGRSPRAAGVDVITLGTRGKRALELGKALGRKMAVLRDNDDQEPDHWRAPVSDYLEDGVREMFIGATSLGRTLEPQMIEAGNDTALRILFGLDAKDDLLKYMLSQKTEWAWRVADSEPGLVWPTYIQEAIEFIDAS